MRYFVISDNTDTQVGLRLAGVEGVLARTREEGLAAIDEARSYLNAKYDCEAIFSATGEDRHATLLEHCKNIAVWNLCRRANTDLIFEQVSEYRRAAIDWLEKVAGLKGTDKPLAPGLPLLKTEDGEVRITARMGSRRKFRHGFDD